MAFRLKKNEALDTGLTRIAREQIDKVIAHLEDDSMPMHERVHSLRARCKRMRALLRLARPAMAARFRTEDERFRAAGRRLCHLRDAHILNKTLAIFADLPRPEIDIPPDPQEFDPAVLKKSLKDMRKARQAVDDWHLKVHGFYDIGAGLGRTYGNARDAWRQAVAEPTDEHFHRLRRWAKHLLFQIMILEPVCEPKLRPFRKELDTLGDVLGLGHDLAVLEQVLRDAGDIDENFLVCVREHKQARYKEALALCNRTLSDPPDRLVADVGGWWADWTRVPVS